LRRAAEVTMITKKPFRKDRMQIAAEQTSG